MATKLPYWNYFISKHCIVKRQLAGCQKNVRIWRHNVIFFLSCPELYDWRQLTPEAGWQRNRRGVRSKRVINYKELADVKLPRTKRPQRTRSHGLYPIEVVERAPDNRVKIHYIGYHARFDEWRGESEIELLTQNNDESENEHDLGSCPPLGHPFSLYHELGTRQWK